MKVSSAKAKGRAAQHLIRDMILEHFKDVLEPDDVQSSIMGESGVDIKLSPLARRLFPYSVESKCVEKLNVWNALEQAENNAKENTTPMLFFKKNRTKPYIAVSAEHYFELLRTINDLKNTTKTP